MLIIDGSMGEGGGQILRSSLALSVCLRKPFRIDNIRKARKRPGLQAQHLAAVNAAAEIGDAEIEGATVGSTELVFRPRGLRTGEFRFDVGTAGSTTLVLQTVLPPLITADGPSHLVLHGGTHNPLAPPYDFLARAFLPLINRMGPKVDARLERPGFFPAGGGLVHVQIVPAKQLQPLHMVDRGKVVDLRARAVVAHLPENIARRELTMIGRALHLADDRLEAVHADTTLGPGNVVTVTVESEHVTEVFTGFGERGVPSEKVATRVVQEVERYLRAGVPVGDYLADQLLLPVAMAGSGSFDTLRPSVHFLTNTEVIRLFLGVEIARVELGNDHWRISLR